jgi:hypothetical protein
MKILLPGANCLFCYTLANVIRKYYVIKMRNNKQSGFYEFNQFEKIMKAVVM